MSRPPALWLIWLALPLWLGCEATPPAAPPPAPLDDDALGYYCGMQATAHTGPKGQIFLAGSGQPLWFTSVRDALAFTRLPEEPKNIVAIYVNDMGRADWNQPGDDSWIDARRALYVVGSSRTGGMGAAELVPFARQQDAAAFASRYGGEVVSYDAIPDHRILGTTSP